MAYGAVVFDKDGRTIFNTNNGAELVAFKGTCSGFLWMDIPGWCFGQDQDVFDTSSNFTKNAIYSGSYTKPNEVFFPWDGTAGDFLDGTEKIVNGTNTLLLNGRTGTGGITYPAPTYTPNYDNAWQSYTTSGSFGSHRPTHPSNPVSWTLTPCTTYKNPVTIYARPQSASFVGKFCMQDDSNAQAYGSNLDRYNHRVRIMDSVTTPTAYQTFEVIVCVSAKDWGGISGTKAHQAGASGEGIHALGPGGAQFHSASPVGQFTTYHTAGRPSKGHTHKAVTANSTASATTTTLGTLPNDTRKKWCRMSGTNYGEIFNVSNVTREYRHHYNWVSNTNISLIWQPIEEYYIPQHVFYSGRSTIFQKNYYGDHLFAVVDFGLGV